MSFIENYEKKGTNQDIDHEMMEIEIGISLSLSLYIYIYIYIFFSKLFKKKVYNDKGMSQKTTTKAKILYGRLKMIHCLYS